MKKLISLLIVAVMMILSLTACFEFVGAPEQEDEPKENVMTHEEFDAAEIDSKVCVDTYVQAKQSWWFNSEKNTGLGTFYTQAEDGAYFIYEMPCTEEEYNALTVGTKIRVTGYKTVWEGEVEIVDASFKILDGKYVAKALDVTGLLGSDSLIDYQNSKVAFKGLTVEASNDAGDAFLYKWNGSGKDGDDLYFKASLDGKTYTFVIESYLCGKTTEVYNAVKALKVGDVIDMEGFLYWYGGAQPHVTSIKTVDLMSYAEFDAADVDSKVCVETYVQAKQSWWFNSEKNTGLGTFYTQSKDGAYFIYEMPCTEEEYNALTVGTKIRVTGYKAIWEGEVEIVEATYEIIGGSYIAEAFDVTDILDSDSLVGYQNSKVAFKGLTVVASNDAGDVFLYKWNGSGKDGDDLYFKASLDGKTYTFVVESYLCDKTTEVYNAVKALQVGDVIDMEGFLYWYDGSQPHITKIAVK